MIAWPESWPFFVMNGGQQCDMVEGPCACGASHSIDELYERLELAGLCKDRESLLAVLRKKGEERRFREQLLLRQYARDFVRKALAGQTHSDETINGVVDKIVRALNKVCR